jgi:hypothetical protein
MAVCYFLVSEISRHCNASVVCTAGNGEYVSFESEKWGGEVTVWANTKEIEYPVTIPDHDLLIIVGSAQMHGYSANEYSDDQFLELLNNNKGAGK